MAPLSIAPHAEALPADVLEARLVFADKLEAMLANDTPWWLFESPAVYRKARAEGTHGFKPPVHNVQARLLSFQGRDGNTIELRVIEPTAGPSRGVWLHFHAGGFVIGSNSSYDTYLTRLSEATGLTMVSVEYRLAPEHPFPAGRNDAVDAALYTLSATGLAALGVPLRALGGESAGAWFAIQVALALRDEHAIDVRQQIGFITAGYGIYDLTYTPSLLSHTRNIVLSRESMIKFTEAAVGHISLLERKTSAVSPLYADLRNLPPCQFLVGNIEPLLDDSIFMAAKWLNASNTAELHIVDAACHAFTLIPMGDATEEGIESMIRFAKKHL